MSIGYATSLGGEPLLDFKSGGDRNLVDDAFERDLGLLALFFLPFTGFLSDLSNSLHCVAYALDSSK